MNNTSPSTAVIKLTALLSEDLDFHGEDSQYASHNFHAFPAKFPPQLPRLFIQKLTTPGDVILDPMAGSGTTILEALLANRRAIGCDIDPLAMMIIGTKTSPLEADIIGISQGILARARQALYDSDNLQRELDTRWDPVTRKFIDEWFDPKIQLELLALIREIEKVQPVAVKNFFKLAFSAIVITKSGGVSLALDLAHTRPHRAKLIIRNGQVLEGQELVNLPVEKTRHATKILRSPLEEFEKRVKNNIKGLFQKPDNYLPARVIFGNAQQIPIQDASVDLIVTSPPYASNAIDYMRAHKFSLVWFGYPITQLGSRRKDYIGGESLRDFPFTPLPEYATSVVDDVNQLDRQKGQTLHRYYSEMAQVIQETFRVLKPGKTAIVVVGSSVMRGRDIETQTCLAEIGKSCGFLVPAIGVRDLDRDRRMLPAGLQINRGSQIQQRMHQEYVIGFYKPER